jgi:hypothetical protein
MCGHTGTFAWPLCIFCLIVEKCAHFLGPVFGPSARFWAQFCGQSARLCGHSATFDMSPCIFCLRVEFLRTFWAQFLGPVPDFGRKFLAERPDCVASKALFAGHFAFSASEWNFYALFGPSARFWAWILTPADISGGICTSSVRFASHQCASPYKNTNPARAGHLLHVLTGSHRCPEC